MGENGRRCRRCRSNFYKTRDAMKAMKTTRLIGKNAKVQCAGLGASTRCLSTNRDDARRNRTRTCAVETTTEGINALTYLTGFGAVGGAGVVLQLTDPEKRRQLMTEEAGGDELKSVGDYFETEGFQRWRRIYDDAENDIEGKSVCDAGCGTGSLTIPLALQGAKVSASDISSAMVEEASRRFQVAAAGQPKAVTPVFEAKDLESLSGTYNTVTCLDVVIHYPPPKLREMLETLASSAEERLIISFAPWTPVLGLLKRIGELFPGKSKATRAYLHSEEDVEQMLKSLGWKVVRRDMTSTSFYFSTIIEAVKA